MKRKILSLVLAAALLASVIPPVQALAEIPTGFLKDPALPLQKPAYGMLYAEPALPLPEIGEDPIRPVENPVKKADEGLTLPVDEPDPLAKAIYTAEELAAVTGGGSYYLGCDIDLSHVEWQGITIDSGGITLDGQGHTISGLSITNKAMANAGLFAAVKGSVTVKNLRIHDVTLISQPEVSINTNIYQAPLIGYVNGSLNISNVTASAVSHWFETNAYTGIGGLVGRVGGSLTVDHCAVELRCGLLTDDGTPRPRYGGAVAALVNGVCLVQNCRSTFQADLTTAGWGGSQGFGGMVGAAQSTAQFISCVSEGVMSGSAAALMGGILAHGSKDVTVDNCVSTVTLGANTVGGMVARGYKNVTAVDCRYVGSMLAPKAAENLYGGIVGDCEGTAAVTGCYVDAYAKLPNDSSSQTLSLGGAAGFAETLKAASSRVCLRVDTERNAQTSLGGLLGSGTSAAVRDSVVQLYGTVTLNSAKSESLGGLIGGCTSAQVSNCSAVCNVFAKKNDSGGVRAGGVIGVVSGSGSAVSLVSVSGELTVDMGANVSSSHSVGGVLGDGTGSLTQCWSGLSLESRYESGSRSLRMGGLIGNGLNACVLQSCWVSGLISVTGAENAPAGGSTVGGLVGHGGRQLTDCAFTGRISNIPVTHLGGLVGQGPSDQVISNCYAKADLSNSSYIGGLVGQNVYSVSLTDCRFAGSVSDADIAGGILGRQNYGSHVAVFTDCAVSAQISAPDGKAGGIVGDGCRSMTRCTFSGTVSGAEIGGLSGGGSGSFYDCEMLGTLAIETSKPMDVSVGGIAVGASRVDSCKVNRHLFLTSSYSNSSAAASLIYKIGGITAKRATVVNCRGKGVSAYVSGGEGSCALRIGGICGDDFVSISSCVVSGSVSGSVTEGSVAAGGLAGRAGEVSDSASGSTVTGGVSAMLSKGTVYAGGALGVGKTNVGVGCAHLGSVSAPAESEDVGVYTEHPLVGNGQFDFAVSPEVPEAPPEVEEETMVIRTFGYMEDFSFSNGYAHEEATPLEGVKVTVNGSAVTVSDSAGYAGLSSSAIDPTALITVKAEKEGYYTSETTRCFTGDGVMNIYLAARLPDRLYISDAIMKRDGDIARDLFSTGSSHGVSISETNDQHFTVTVDWNGSAENSRRLYITNENESPLVPVPVSGQFDLNLADWFQPEEQLYIKAAAVSETGLEMTEKRPLYVKLFKFMPKLVLPPASTDLGGGSGVYFLEGFSVDVDLGDLIQYAQSVEVVDDVMRIKLGDSNPDAQIPKDIRLFPHEMVKMFVGGVIEIPVTDEKMAAEGVKGGVRIEINQKSKQLTPNTAELIYTVPVCGIPVNFSLEIGAGFTAELGLHGLGEQLHMYGVLEGSASITGGVSAGLEGSSKPVEAYVKGGVEGVGKLPITFDITDGAASIDPQVEGSVFAEALVKAFEQELRLKLKLGQFTWNLKDGISWLEETDPAQWTPMDRQYLTMGGGFVRQPDASPLAFTGAEESHVLYENIFGDSRAVTTREVSTPVIYYTADDGQGGGGLASDHTALWKTSLQEDGTWGEPEVIASSGLGYPAMPDADNTAVVWVNSTETGSLDAMLQSTEIRIRYGSDGQEKVIDGGGYVCSPKVSAPLGSGRVLVTWLADSTVSAENLCPTAPVLHYAMYNGSVWTEGTVETGGEIPEGAVPSCGDTIQIIWKSESGVLYRSYGDDFASKQTLISGVTGWDSDGVYIATISSGGLLKVWEGGSQQYSLQTDAPNAVPTLASDSMGSTAVIWNQNGGLWYADSLHAYGFVKQLSDQPGSRVSAVMDSLQPLLVSYETDGQQENLCVLRGQKLEGVDLSVSQPVLTYDPADDGLAELRATVTNLREGLATVAATLTDENGNKVYSMTISGKYPGYQESVELLMMFPADLTREKTYTLTVSSVRDQDYDPSNNAVTVTTTGYAALHAVDFVRMPDGSVGLEAIVASTGIGPMTGCTVTVYPASQLGDATGEALFTQSFDSIPGGYFRQALLESTVNDGWYRVILTAGGEELDTALVHRRDPVISTVSILSVSADGVVNLHAESWNRDLILVTAFYDESGRLTGSTVTELAPWEGEKTVAASGSGVQCKAYLLDASTMAPVCMAGEQ